jgi:hypothetical protein
VSKETRLFLVVFRLLGADFNSFHFLSSCFSAMSPIVLSSSFSITELDNVVASAEHYKAHDGDQAVIFFRNGFGASVVRHSYSYGGREGFYELAVIVKDEKDPRDFRLTYETSVTDDVLGWLTADDVVEKLKEISRL